MAKRPKGGQIERVEDVSWIWVAEVEDKNINAYCLITPHPISPTLFRSASPLSQHITWQRNEEMSFLLCPNPDGETHCRQSSILNVL